MRNYNIDDFWKDGKLKCACCKEFKDPKTEFGKASALYQNGPRKGYKSYCKKCTKERINQYRTKNVNTFKPVLKEHSIISYQIIMGDMEPIKDLKDLGYRIEFVNVVIVNNKPEVIFKVT